MLPSQVELELAFSALEELEGDWELAVRQMDRHDSTVRPIDGRELLIRRLEDAVIRFAAVSARFLSHDAAPVEPDPVAGHRFRRFALPAE